MQKLLYIAIFFFTLSSCSDNLLDGPPSLVVYIEDSPADFQAVNINLKSVEIFGQDQWTKLTSYRGVISIMNYTGGSALEIVNQPITPGSYTKLRLNFEEQGNTLAINGQVRPLTIANQNIELPIALEFAQGPQYITCDMDVAASIDTVTNSIAPVITVIDLATAGAISGVIATKDGTKIAETMLVKVASSTGFQRSTFTNKTTGSLFMRLSQGEYTVYIEPSSTSKYKKDTLNNIMVNAAQATMLNIIEMTPINNEK